MSAIKQLVFSALSAAIVAALPGAAFAAGDAASGLTLAKTWCVTCHIVAPNVAGGDNAQSQQSADRRRHRLSR
jgi:cytochrome c2